MRDDTPLLLAPAEQGEFQPLLWALMLLEGVGVLFPWNAFITVTEYFSTKLDGSHFESNFENYFSFTFQLFNILFLIVDVLYGNKFKTRTRILIPLCVQLVVFALMTVFVKVDMAPNTFFGVTLVLVIFAGGATAFLQGGFFSLAAVMRSKYTQAQMTGQGLGGLIVSLLNVLTLAVGGKKNNAENAAFIFFIIAVGLIAICIAGFLYMVNHPYVKLMLRRNHLIRQESIASIQSLGGDTSTWAMAKSAVAQTKLPAIMVMTTFAITLAIFPGITDRIQSTADPETLWAKRYFVPVTCFVFFNLGDTIGRSLSLWWEWPGVRNYRKLRIPVFARVVFIVLFLFCNVQLSDTGESKIPVGFKSDAWPSVFMLVMAFTNGYFGNLCMEYGPQIADEHNQSMAGAFMALSLTVGLLLGTLINFALKAILCGCNPFVSG
ncbi:hypothetical protein PTSG_02591 [Salpingoeca rosetta]|uniref:Equilibrative nucleoside transporter 1 n=1 Tax=Salpingoeca rosetta (strain ATCC 50818 / BSB-021) TaxID=946362 RepID=F2U2R2_SALR5|nr:uncharacterized protein PTSG_02591 [Salpingoeca rosetta]EGD81906.1 hypothetical protein PTSG_02591 [Salpingoeca rosetta]|eukprot:XP_004996089.1 hypothetical protein PTSG_02591 [Salpingoeca rosetta]